MSSRSFGPRPGLYCGARRREEKERDAPHNHNVDRRQSSVARWVSVACTLDMRLMTSGLTTRRLVGYTNSYTTFICMAPSRPPARARAPRGLLSRGIQIHFIYSGECVPTTHVQQQNSKSTVYKRDLILQGTAWNRLFRYGVWKIFNVPAK